MTWPTSISISPRHWLEEAVLVGACFGGWIAAEMAVRDTRRFAHLVLVDPLGIKVGGVTERDIADMHAMSRDEYVRLAWADPAKGERDLMQMPETELAGLRAAARRSLGSAGSPTCTTRI